MAASRKPTDPAKTATMAGGLFAVDRDFFWKVDHGCEKQVDISTRSEVTTRGWWDGGERTWSSVSECGDVGEAWRSTLAGEFHFATALFGRILQQDITFVTSLIFSYGGKSRGHPCPDGENARFADFSLSQN